MLMILFKAKTTFTTVTRNKLTIVVKLINGKDTVVVTSLTAAHGSAVFQVDNLVDGEHLCISSFFFTLFCN